jgi:hypothetical protein
MCGSIPVSGFASRDLRSPKEQTAVFNDTPDYFIGGLEDRDPLAAGHRYDGIRRHFDVFNQIAIDYEYRMVEPCEPYHFFKTFWHVLSKNRCDLADEVFERRPLCNSLCPDPQSVPPIFWRLGSKMIGSS